MGKGTKKGTTKKDKKIYKKDKKKKEIFAPCIFVVRKWGGNVEGRSSCYCLGRRTLTQLVCRIYLAYGKRGRFVTCIVRQEADNYNEVGFLLE